jgi:hypothetical protein
MRRTRHDVFARARQTRYIVIWDMLWRLIDYTEIPPGFDLRASLARAIERHGAEGWQPEGAPDHGFVFLSRGGERRLLLLTERHPQDQSRQTFDPHRRNMPGS